MLTDTQAATWLQQRINRDETAFRQRNGAKEALSRLRSASEALVYRASGDRVDLIFGRKLGGLELGAARAAAAVEDFVRRFYLDYWAVFSASPLPAGSLRVERVRSAATTVAEVRQHIDGIPVADARWTLIFDRGGHLTHVMGGPFDPAKITVARRPKVDSAQAIALALDQESLAPGDVEAEARLAIEGRTNRLVWTVALDGKRTPAVFREVGIDAHQRTVLSRRDRREHSVIEIPVTHYSHPSGIKDSSGSTTTSRINVDAVELTFPPKVPNPPPGPLYTYSLQRLGSGRSRIWNAKPVGADPTPVFSRTTSSEKNYFTKQPGTTTNNVFNEQQTYYWAQTLKTAMDEWGREPNDYGHYPVDASRAVNAEIVVNGDAAMEDDWDNSDGVMHGYFRSDAPGSWFHMTGNVPAVFLFNSAGNSDSPQFFGPEYSGSYSIIAHEVGHFISWQYGGWQGPSGTRLGRALNEGHSMVLAALLGKRCFSALEYNESACVTTGGDGQWSHFVFGKTPLKYSDMDCVNDGNYYLAWPYVQAMWQLMNNKDLNGDPIWSNADAAITNTADLFMYSLHSFTADTTMTFDKLCLGLLTRVRERISEGLEKGALPETFCGVYGVFSQHGLLTGCRNSP